MIPNLDLDRLRAYLEGELAPEEESTVEARLKTEPALADALIELSRADVVLAEWARMAPPARVLPTRRRLVRPSGRRERHGSWLPLLVAAGIAMGVILVAAVATSEPHLPKPQPTAAQGLPEPEIVKPSPNRVPERPPLPERVQVRRPETEAIPVPIPAPPPSPAPQVPQPESPRPAPAPAPTPAVETKTALARLERAEGEVYAVRSEGRQPVRAGHDCLPGQGLETVGASSRTAIRFPDGTRVEIGPNTKLTAMKDDAGKNLGLERGHLAADVPKQPEGRPFVVATASGDVRVLGTRFSITASVDGTRVEVREGRVRLTRRGDGAAVEVVAGHYAVAATGVAMAQKPLPIDDILLTPANATLSGDEWRVGKDQRASTGLAIETHRHLWRAFPSPTDPAYLPMRKYTSVVTYTFAAEADRDYKVWIRGMYVQVPGRSGSHGSIGLEPVTGRFTTPCPWYSKTGENGFMFDFWSNRAGYWWIGGNEGTTPPVWASIRFTRPGTQTLKLYATEPVLIDVVWLSATQKTRPEDGQKGPTDPAKK